MRFQTLLPPQDQHVRLSTIAGYFTPDARDNPLDAHKGMLQSVELDFNATKLGSSVNFAKLTEQTAYYRPVFHNIVWDGAGHNQRSGGPTHHKDKTERCGALCELRKQTEERLTGDVGRAQKHHVETAPARRCLMS